MAWIYISITIVGITCVGFVTTIANKRGVPGEDMTFSLFSISSIIGFFVVLFNSGASYSSAVILTALICGTGGSIAYFLFNKAVEKGHYGFSNAIYRSSFMTAVVFGIIYFKQTLTVLNATGILLILSSIFAISLSLGSFSLKKKYEQSGLIWLIIILSAFLLSGLPRIGQDLVANLKMDKYVYLFLSYLPGSIIFFSVCLKKRSYNRKALIFGSMGAVASYASVFCTIAALASLKGFIVFPVTLSGPIILGVLLSVFYFKEKIKPLGYFGIFLGISGITLLKAFN